MPNSSAVRWKSALIICALFMGSIIYIWTVDSGNRQSQVMSSFLAFFITAILLLVWLLIFSRLPWPVRWKSLGGAAIIFAIPTLFWRIDGVTGDLLPIISSRWTDSEQTRIEGRRVSTDIPDGELAALPWPQFLGSDRTAVVGGVRLNKNWKNNPPAELWRRTIGAGWAGFSVTGTQALTMEQAGDFERITSLDLYSGEPHWAYEYEARYESTIAGTGPRSTPTIAGERVFTLGATGILTCLGLTGGNMIWQTDVVANNQARVNEWGTSCSPLLLDSIVVVSSGQKNANTIIAYDAADGRELWAADTASAGYSSPQFTVLAGVPQIVTFNQGWLSGLVPETGESLWRLAWPKETQPVAQPVLLNGNQLFVSSGYGIGCKLFEFAAGSPGSWEIQTLWETRRMKAKFANVVLHDGYIYGLDDGVLVCLDPADGERKWKQGRYGHGQIILAGDMILVQSEHGEIILVEARPDAYVETARRQLFDSKTWNPPAFAAPYLLIRNDREVVCLRLPLLQTPTAAI